MPDLSITLASATLLQALAFAAVLLVGRDRGDLSVRLLVTLMLVVAIEKTDQLFLASGAVFDHPRWAMIGNVFGALLAPLVYLHLKVRTQSPKSLEAGDILIALPFVVVAIYVLGTYHILPFDEKLNAFRDGSILTPMNRYVLPIVGDLVTVGFLVAAMLRLARHDAAVFRTFSLVEDRLFQGVRTTLLIMAGLVLVHFLWTLTRIPGIGVSLNLGHFLLVNALGMSGIRSAKPAMRITQPPTVQTSPDRVAQDDALESLDAVMRDAEPFLDPDLTLDQLARAARIKPRLVSEALNRGRGENFYTYVNQWRIAAARKSLLDAPTRSVLDIALECGFNSKSAFNTAFKRITLATPSAWRRQQKS